jgi:hypothetical protein
VPGGSRGDGRDDHVILLATVGAGTGQGENRGAMGAGNAGAIGFSWALEVVWTPKAWRLPRRQRQRWWHC